MLFVDRAHFQSWNIPWHHYLRLYKTHSKVVCWAFLNPSMYQWNRLASRMLIPSPTYFNLFINLHWYFNKVSIFLLRSASLYCRGQSIDILAITSTQAFLIYHTFSSHFLHLKRFLTVKRMAPVFTSSTVDLQSCQPLAIIGWLLFLLSTWCPRPWRAFPDIQKIHWVLIQEFTTTSQIIIYRSEVFIRCNNFVFFIIFIMSHLYYPLQNKRTSILFF